MSLTDIFNDSFRYPISDIPKFVVFGVLVLVSSLGFVNFGNEVLTGLLRIIGFIIGILVSGYCLSIVKNAIILSDEVPTIDIQTNFIDGIKMIVLLIVYYIIPSIIVSIVALASGLFDQVSKVLPYIAQNGTAANIPQNLLYSLGTSSVITALVAVIVFIIFTLLFYAAIGRLAKYDSLSAGLNIPDAARDIGRIGVGKFVGWAILLAVIACVFLVVEAFIGLIPYVGVLISAFLVTTYLMFISYRSIGLLYSSI
jgi:hypothetical protein